MTKYLALFIITLILSTYTNNDLNPNTSTATQAVDETESESEAATSPYYTIEIIENTPTEETTQSSQKDPTYLLTKYIESENDFFFLLYDFTRDGYPEIITPVSSGLQSSDFLCFNNILDNSFIHIGQLSHTAILDETKYTMEHYYDPIKNMDLYYSITIERYNKPYVHLSESLCWYKNGVFLDKEYILHQEEIPKDDDITINEKIQQLRQNMNKYEFIEFINFDSINFNEKRIDGYEDIIRNYGKTEPYIVLNINGTPVQYPWNTYRFELTEEFDWSELNKLPNLKFVKVNFDNPNADYEKLVQLSNIDTLEICTTLENYDWLSDMTWLQGLEIGECSDLSFAAPLTELKFLTVTAATDKVDFVKPLVNHTKLENLIIWGESDEQLTWERENLK